MALNLNLLIEKLANSGVFIKRPKFGSFAKNAKSFKYKTEKGNAMVLPFFLLPVTFIGFRV